MTKQAKFSKNIVLLMIWVVLAISVIMVANAISVSNAIVTPRLVNATDFVQFRVTYSDIIDTNSDYNLLVCKDSTCTGCSTLDSTGCYCNESTGSATFANCSYTTGLSDSTTSNYWVKVLNTTENTSVLVGTDTSFTVNHYPTLTNVTITTDEMANNYSNLTITCNANGGDDVDIGTISGEAVNYNITFFVASNNESASIINVLKSIPSASSTETLICADYAACNKTVTINCTVRVYDKYGYYDASADRTSNISLRDAPPSRPGVSITPTSPSIMQKLTCSVSTLSQDLIDTDDTINYSYKWYNNSAYVETLTIPTTSNITNNLSSDYTNELENWTCTVTPFSGSLDNSSNATVANASVVIGEFISGTGIAADPSIDIRDRQTYYNVSDTLEFFATYVNGTNQTMVVCKDSSCSNCDVNYTTSIYDSTQSGCYCYSQALTNGTAGSGDTLTCNYTIQYSVNTSANFWVRLYNATNATSAIAEGNAFIVNHAPNMTNITITNSTKGQNSVLNCSVNGADDPDGDPITYNFTMWWTNATNATKLVNQSTTSNSITFDCTNNCTKNSKVNCTVLLIDDNIDFNISFFKNTSITIGNTIPSISVGLLPTSAVTNQELQCNTSNMTDPDAGDTITYTYRWYKDGVIQSGLTMQSNTNTSYNLTASNTNPGDSWVCEATPSDATDTGTAQNSSAVVIVAGGTSVTWSEFTHEDTINFTNVNESSITNVKIGVTDTGLIDFGDQTLNLTDANLDNIVEISSNRVSIDSASFTNLNKSATITMLGLTYDKRPALLIDGEPCNESNETCLFLNYSSGTGILNFNVSHFTAFTTQNNSQMTIYDDTDSDRGSLIRNGNESIRFFANYTNSTRNDSQGYNVIRGASCTISYSHANGTQTGTMELNETTGLYDYNRSFNSTGTFTYNVSCANSTFETLTVEDTVLVSENSAPSLSSANIVSNAESGYPDTSTNLMCQHGIADDVDEDFRDLIIDADGNMTVYGDVRNSKDKSLNRGDTLLNFTDEDNMTFYDRNNNSVFDFGTDAIVRSNYTVYSETESNAMIIFDAIQVGTENDIGYGVNLTRINGTSSMLLYYDNNSDGNYTIGEDIILENTGNNQYDDVVNYTYLWYVNDTGGDGTFKPCNSFGWCDNDDNDILTHGNTITGDKWICQVTPYDSDESGLGVNSSVLTIGLAGVGGETTAPFIINISDTSTAATPTNIGERMNITINWTDADSRRIIVYVCNTTSIVKNSGCFDFEFNRTYDTADGISPFASMFNASIPLDTERFDVITGSHPSAVYYVQACDDSYACSNIANETLVVNRLPVIYNVTLNSTGLNDFSDDDNLVCNNGSNTVPMDDRDEDAINLTYAWFVKRSGEDNYSKIDVPTDTGTLSNGYTQEGDTFICQITPYDSYDYGAGLNSSPKVIGEVAIEGAVVRPTILNVTDDSNVSYPTNVGDKVTFTIWYSDSDSSLFRAFVCNSSDITASGCMDYEYNRTSWISTNPIIATYTVREEDPVNWTNYSLTEANYSVMVCDDSYNCSVVYNNDTDSDGAWATNFSVNHRPNASGVTINTIQPFPDTVLNCTFTFNDKDGDARNKSLTEYVWYVANDSGTNYLIVEGQTSNNITQGYGENSNVICGIKVYDEHGFGDSSFRNSSRVWISEQPIAPRITNLPSAIGKTEWVMVGYVNDSDVNITVVVNQDYNAPLVYSDNSTGNSTFMGKTTALATTTNGTNYTIVSSTLADLFKYSNYTFFATHNRSNFTGYFITDVTDLKNGQLKVNVSPQLEHNVTLGSDIYVYNTSVPQGYFTVNMTTLYEGQNTLTIYGSRNTSNGPSVTRSLYVDTVGPAVSNGTIQPVYNQLTFNLSFNITDNFAINTSTLRINISDYPNQNNLTFNYSSSNLTCSGNATLQRCNLTLNLRDSRYYSVNMLVTDNVSNTNSTVIGNFTLNITGLNINAVNDGYIDTDNNSQLDADVAATKTLAANWSTANWSTLPETGIEYYEYRILEYDNTEYKGEIVNWTSRGLNQTVNRTLSLTNKYVYYFDVRAKIINGPYTNTTRSNGVLYLDTTAPTCDNCITDEGDFLASDNALTASWNFTDNESRITLYEYAVGSAEYPLPGYANVVPVTQTTSSSVSLTELSLTNGSGYYFSVRARNENNIWGAWASSNNITVDTNEPSNGNINYSTGYILNNNLTVTFEQGNDTISGVNNTQLYMASVPLSQGACLGTFIYNKYDSQVLGDKSETVNTSSGNCYRFQYWVTDRAGNTKIYPEGISPDVMIDITGPGVFTATANNGDFFTYSGTFNLEWTDSSDPETGIDYYTYVLLEDNVPMTNTTTNTSQNTAQVSVSATHQKSYKFNVTAYNVAGATRLVSSNAVLFIDNTPPNTASVVRVENDTTSEDGYIDLINNNNTNITIFVEAGSSCVAAEYDIDYTNDLTQSFEIFNCTSRVSSEYMNCSVDVNDGNHTYYIVCSDSAGNAQTATQNLEVNWVVDFNGPNISIDNPTTDEVVGGLINLRTNISDVIGIRSARYEVVNESDLSHVWASGSLDSSTDYDVTFNSSVNLSNKSLSVMLRVFANDTQGQDSTANVTFTVDNTRPVIEFVMPNLDNRYFKSGNKTINITLQNFVNASYNVYNLTGGRVQNGSVNNTILVTFSYNFSDTLNTTNLDDGNYTLVVYASDFVNSNNKTFEFFVDKIGPVYDIDGIARSPDTVYENSNVQLNVTWPNTFNRFFNRYDLERIVIEHNATSTLTNYTAVLSDDDTSVSYVIIASGEINNQEYVVWRGYAVDFAGNVNMTPQYNFTVSNRDPVFNVTINDLTFPNNVNRTINISLSFGDQDTSENLSYWFMTMPNRTLIFDELENETNIDANGATISNLTFGNGKSQNGTLIQRKTTNLVANPSFELSNITGNATPAVSAQINGTSLNPVHANITGMNATDATLVFNITQSATITGTRSESFIINSSCNVVNFTLNGDGYNFTLFNGTWTAAQIVSYLNANISNNVSNVTVIASVTAPGNITLTSNVTGVDSRIIINTSCLLQDALGMSNGSIADGSNATNLFNVSLNGQFYSVNITPSQVPLSLFNITHQINQTLANVSFDLANGSLYLQSNLSGANSSVYVHNGSANNLLGFSNNTERRGNDNINITDDNNTLNISINSGSYTNITFESGNWNLSDITRWINNNLSSVLSATSGTNATFQLSTVATGSSATLTIGVGSLNTELGLSTGDTSTGVDYTYDAQIYNWTLSGSPIYNLSTTDAPDGRGGVVVNLNNYYKQTVSVTGGADYTLSAYMKAANESEVYGRLHINWLDSGGNVISTSPICGPNITCSIPNPTVTTSFVRYNGSTVSPSNAVEAEVVIDANDEKYVQVDAVQFEENAYATSFINDSSLDGIRGGSQLMYSRDDNWNGDSGTVELFIRPTWNGSDTTRHVLFDVDGTRNALSQDFSIEHTTYQSNATLGLFVGDSSFYYTNLTKWGRGSLHSVFATWQDGTTNLYVDGVYVGGVNEMPPSTLTSDVYVGSDTSLANQADGIIDNFGLFENVRNITQLMGDNSTSPLSTDSFNATAINNIIINVSGNRTKGDAFINATGNVEGEQRVKFFATDGYSAAGSNRVSVTVLDFNYKPTFNWTQNQTNITLLEDTTREFNMTYWFIDLNNDPINYTWEDREELLLCHFDNLYVCNNGKQPLNYTNVTFSNGKFGNGVLVDSSDNLSFTSSDVINLSQGTLFMWVNDSKHESNISMWADNATHVFIDASNTSDAAVPVQTGLKLFKNNSNFLVFMMTNTSGERFNLSYYVGGFVENISYHIGITWAVNGTGLLNMSMYINGTRVANVSGESLGVINTSDLMYVGMEASLQNQSNASIDELMISRKVFNSSEVMGAYKYEFPLIDVLFNNETEIGTVVPDSDYYGTVDVRITGIDPYYLNATSNNFTIDVVNVNDQPVLLAIGNQSIKAGIQLNLTVNATDVDYNDTVSFTSNMTDSNFSLNSVTGSITWSPDESYVGVVYVNLSVCDNSAADNNCTAAIFNITVLTNVPVLLQDIGTVNVQEDSNATLNMSLYFSDDDALNYSVNSPYYLMICHFDDSFDCDEAGNSTGNATNVTFASGVFANGINATYNSTLMYYANGSIDLEQGTMGMWVRLEHNISNTSINRFLFDMDNSSAGVRNRMYLNISADILEYGVIDNSHNRYVLTANVSDWGIDESRHIAVTWTQGQQRLYLNGTLVNSSSSLTPISYYPFAMYIGSNASNSSKNPSPAKAIIDEFFISSLVWDSTTMKQAYKYGLPPLNVTIDNSTEIVTILPTSNYSGTEYLKITAYDTTSLNTSSNNFTVVVQGVNDMPYIVAISGQTATDGQLFNLSINATDADYGDTLYYYENVTDSNFSINGSGWIEWTPQDDDVGNNSVNITVCDDSGADNNCNSIEFTVNVSDANDAPYSSADIPDISVNESNSTVLILNNYFDDPNKDNLNFTHTNPYEILMCTFETNGTCYNNTPSKEQNVTYKSGKFNNGVLIAGDNNLLLGGGFENTTDFTADDNIGDNFTAWETNASVSIADLHDLNDSDMGNLSAYLGNNSLRLMMDNDTYVENQTGIWQTVRSGTNFSGQTLTLSFWAKGNATPSNLSVMFDDDTAEPFNLTATGGTTYTVGINNTWTYYNLTHTVSSSALNLVLRLLPMINTSDQYNTTYAVYIDGVQLENGSKASEYLSDGPDVLRYNVSDKIDPEKGTIEMWVIPEWNHNDSKGHMFIDSQEGPYQLRIEKGTDNYLRAGWSTGVTEYGVVLNSTEYSLNRSTMHHIALTWNKSSAETKLYLDGRLKGTSTSIYTVNLTNDVTIGSSENFTSFADATFDNLRITTDVKNADNVLNTYNRNYPLVDVVVDNATSFATITPRENYTGIDYLQFTAFDPEGLSGASNNVTVTVIPVNEKPSFNLSNPISDYNISEDGNQSLSLRGIFYDNDNDALTYQVEYYTRKLLCHYDGTTVCEDGVTPSLDSGITYNDGKFDRGILVNSADSLAYNISSFMDGLNYSEGTVEAWVKPTWNHTDNENHVLVEISNSTSFFVIQKHSDNQFKAGWVIAGVDTRAILNSTEYALNDSQLHHIAVTWNTTDTVVYMDGDKKKNTTGVKTVNLTNLMYVGSSSDSQNYFNGVIDEFRLSNRTKTAWDVDRTYRFEYPTIAIYVDNTTSNVTFIPQDDFDGRDFVRFRAYDPSLANTHSNNIVLNINGSNDDPVFTSNNTISDLSFANALNNTNITLIDYYSDPEGDSLNYTIEYPKTLLVCHFDNDTRLCQDERDDFPEFNVSKNGTSYKVGMYVDKVSVVANTVALFRFNENDNDTISYTVNEADIIGNASLGNSTLANGSTATKPLYVRGCVEESCLKFDGVDDYVSANQTNAADLGENVTVEAWVKLEQQTCDNVTFQQVVGIDNNTLNKSWSLFITAQHNGTNATMTSTGGSADSNFTIGINESIINFSLNGQQYTTINITTTTYNLTNGSLSAYNITTIINDNLTGGNIAYNLTDGNIQLVSNISGNASNITFGKGSAHSALGFTNGSTASGTDYYSGDCVAGMAVSDDGVSVNGSVVGTTRLNDGQWHYLVGLVNSSNLTIYVDGSVDNITSWNFTLATSSYPLEIGRRGTYNDNLTIPGNITRAGFFNGSIDDVRVLNKSLTNSEIYNNYIRAMTGVYINSTANMSMGVNQNFNVAKGTVEFWLRTKWESATDVSTRTFIDITQLPIVPGQLKSFSIIKNATQELIAGWIVDSVDYRVHVGQENYTIEEDVPVHIAFTWDNSTDESKLYMDGQLVGENDNLRTTNLTSDIFVGSRFDNTRKADAIFDELRIYDYVKDNVSINRTYTYEYPFVQGLIDNSTGIVTLIARNQTFVGEDTIRFRAFDTAGFNTTSNNLTVTITEVFVDTDNDGTPDTEDDDDDNDGIPDVNDSLTGNVTHIQTNITGMNISIDSSYNTSQEFDGLKFVNITINTTTLVTFWFNFSDRTLVLSDVEIFRDASGESLGYVVVNGVNITPGLTKTVHVYDIDSTTETVCVKDMENVLTVSNFTNNCTGVNETSVVCDGSNSTAYTCYNRDTYYEVQGLNHSAVREITTCIDNDGDGYGTGCALGPDCDDTDAGVNALLGCPGAGLQAAEAGGGGGGGGGGSSGGGAPGSGAASAIITEGFLGQKIYGSLLPDQIVEWYLEKEKIGITSIKFKVIDEVYGVHLKVLRLVDMTKYDIELLSAAYQYMKVDHLNLDNLNIYDVKIGFRVNNTWIKLGFSRSRIKLMRYGEEGWEKLTTRLVADDGLFSYFEADSPDGLSFFAIADESGVILPSARLAATDIGPSVSTATEKVQVRGILGVTGAFLKSLLKQGGEFFRGSEALFAYLFLLVIITAAIAGVYLNWEKMPIVGKVPEQQVEEHTVFGPVQEMPTSVVIDTAKQKARDMYDAKLIELEEYMSKEMSKGLTKDKLEKNLAKLGWSTSVVESLVQLEHYMRISFSHGRGYEDVKKVLLGQGWSLKVIEAVATKLMAADNKLQYLEGWITSEISQGHPKPKIKQMLTAQGWSLDLVDIIVEVIDFVDKAVKAGKSKTVIRKELKSAGWPSWLVEEGLKNIKK